MSNNQEQVRDFVHNLAGNSPDAATFTQNLDRILAVASGEQPLNPMVSAIMRFTGQSLPTLSTEEQEQLANTRETFANLQANDPNFNQAFFTLAKSDGFKTAELDTLFGGNENDLLGQSINHLTSTPMGAKAITAGLTTLATDADITREDAVRAMGNGYTTQMESVIASASAAETGAADPNAFIEELRNTDGLLGDHSTAENKAFFDELTSAGNEAQRDAFITAVKQNPSFLAAVSIDAARAPAEPGALMRLATFDAGEAEAGITNALDEFFPEGAASGIASGFATSQLFSGSEELRNNAMTDFFGNEDIDWVETAAVVAGGGNPVTGNSANAKAIRKAGMDFGMQMFMNGSFSLDNIGEAWDMLLENWEEAFAGIMNATDNPMLKGVLGMFRDIIPVMLEGLGRIFHLGAGMAQQVGLGIAIDESPYRAMTNGQVTNIRFTEREAAEAILDDVKNSFGSPRLNDNTAIHFDGGEALSIAQIRTHLDNGTMTLEDVQELAGEEYATQLGADGKVTFSLPYGQNDNWRDRGTWENTSQQEMNDDGTPKLDSDGEPVYVQRAVFTPQGPTPTRSLASTPVTADAAQSGITVASSAGAASSTPAAPATSGPTGFVVGGGGTSLPLNDIFNNLGLTNQDFITVDPDGVNGPETSREMKLEEFKENYPDGTWAVDQINYDSRADGTRQTLTTVNAIG